MSAQDNPLGYLSGVSPSHRVCSVLPRFFVLLPSDGDSAQASVAPSSVASLLTLLLSP